MPTLTIASLRGGMNNSDPPIALADDQCTVATNVEFLRSTCGERRRGAEAFSLAGSDLAACARIVWVYRHQADADPQTAQLWAAGLSTDGLTVTLAYNDGSWHTVTVPDAITCDGLSEYQIEAASLHGKLFLFYNSSVDYTHVYDPRTSTTALRRAGLAPMVTAPTAVDTGVGTLSGTRYYRTREIVQAGGVTILRSEPSEALTFVLSGTGAAVTVTRSATVNSNATHWELEGSQDGSNFYVFAAQVSIAATDYVDGITGAYADTMELSENIGDYEPPHSAKYGIADADRLVMFGAWEDDDLSSSVSWTPVSNATGVGNDERVPLDPSGGGSGVSSLNLDNFNGGAITDVASAVAGEVWVFKLDHTYKLTRTGQLARAYNAMMMSGVRGAIRWSACEGVDPAGNPAVFFADASVGPCLISEGRIQQCGQDIWGTWQDVYVNASVPAGYRSLYYPQANQFFVWILRITDITGSSVTYTTERMVLQVNEMRATPSGWRRGWSVSTCTSTVTSGACLYYDDSTIGNTRTLKPFVGMTVGGSAAIWKLDTGDDDAGTDYAAQITTKPYAPTNLEAQFEIKSATLVAKATEDATLTISAIPDFGTAVTKIAEDLDLSPAGSEVAVIRKKDELGIAECTTVQIDFSDTAAPGARWELARFSMTLSAGQGS